MMGIGKRGSALARCWYLVFMLIIAVPSLAAGSLQHYTSSIDGSQQPYGLYVPPGSYSVPYPVIFIGHGFGGVASEYFAADATEFADAHGVLLVQLHGRGNTFYDGVGEVDFFDVLAELRRNFAIDADRLYFEGASMGATGAYRLGVRHPDVLAAVAGADGWGDYREWYSHWYGPTRNPDEVAPFRLPNLLAASCVDVAVSAKWQQILMIADLYDDSVLPVNAERLAEQLAALGDATPEGDYAHLLQYAYGGHCAGYNPPLMYQFFLGQRRVTSPPRVTIATTRLKYGAQFWARMERMQTVNAMALLDAAISGQTVRVTARELTQFTLSLAETTLDSRRPVRITVNGLPAYSGPVKTVTLYAQVNPAGAISGWSTVNTLPGGLQKTPTLEGPIGDAYTSKFLVVYGAAGSAADTQANKDEANTFCMYWNNWMGGTIAPLADTAVTAAHTATRNLILFGTADSNSYLRAIQPSLPIKVTNTGVTVGAREFRGANYGAYFIYPNPKNPARYVVVSHGKIPGAREKDLEALPWYWPDYVVFDKNRQPGACIQSSLAYLPDTFVHTGYFDTRWRLPREAAPLTGVSLKASPDTPVTVGTPVALTAVPTGGTGTQYRFSVGLPITPLRMRWTVVRAWNTSPTAAWKPTTLGPYTLLVEAREPDGPTAIDTIPSYRVLPRR